MSRSTRKPPPTGTRPISDFFTRKVTVASSSSSTGAQSSRHSKPLKPKSSRISTSNSSATSFSSMPHSALFEGVEIVSSPKASRSEPFSPVPIQPGPLKSPVTHSSRKRRKSKFDSDSDVEPPGSVVYVTKASVSPSKPRSFSSDPCPQCPNRPDDVLQSVPLPSIQQDDDLFVNVDITIPSDSTPTLPTGFPPSISSPKPLDPEGKASHIIAEIKAKAYADNLLSLPDSPLADFKETLSDSSDDEDCLLLSPSRRREEKINPMAQKMDMMGSKSSSTSIQASRLHRLRNHSLSPSPSVPPSSLLGSPRSSRPTRVMSTRPPRLLTQHRKDGRAKGKVPNPLDELLKEKRLADRRGNGDEAFRKAEAAVKNKDFVLQDMDDLMNEETARVAVSDLERMNVKSSSPSFGTSEDEEIAMEEMDRQRLFGEEGGKAIKDIVERDKIERQKERESEKLVGIPLWQTNSLDLMEVDESNPTSPGRDHQHLLLSMIASALENKDSARAALLMSSGAVTTIKFGEFPDVIPYLCEIALSAHETSLTTSCTLILTDIWGRAFLPTSGITFSMVLMTLVRLGARRSILENLGWTLASDWRITPHAVHQRHSIICRLTALLTSAARSRNLLTKEIPDILLALILVANDPSTSADLQCALRLAIDEICRSVASGADISADIETDICTKIVQYLATLEPINKAFIVSLLGSGTGRTRRLARWVAHGVITDARVIDPKSYSDLPDLSPILTQLAQQSSESTPGKFEQHDKTDFVDMGLYIQILGVAITNIPGYVMEEGRTGQSKAPLLPKIRKSLERLHSSISDIRATHLDRSRTKAALKELSLRIYYQHSTAQQNASTLHSYFSKTRNKKRG